MLLLSMNLICILYSVKKTKAHNAMCLQQMWQNDAPFFKEIPGKQPGFSNGWTTAQQWSRNRRQREKHKDVHLPLIIFKNYAILAPVWFCGGRRSPQKLQVVASDTRCGCGGHNAQPNMRLITQHVQLEKSRWCRFN